MIQEAGYVGLMGREGEEGVLSDVVPESFILPGLTSVLVMRWSRFLAVSVRTL